MAVVMERTQARVGVVHVVVDQVERFGIGRADQVTSYSEGMAKAMRPSTPWKG